MTKSGILFTCLALVVANVAPLMSQAVSTEPNALVQVIKVSLQDCVSVGKKSLRWSPKGAKIALKSSQQDKSPGLVGTLNLGPKQSKPMAIRLFKSGSSEHLNRLWLDENRDGIESAREFHGCQVNKRRGKFWSSFGGITLTLPGDPKATKTTRAYPISLWYVFDPQEPKAQQVLRWSRRGWHQGQVKLKGQECHIYLAESRLDGIFDRQDAWFLAASEDGLFSTSKSRRLTDHAWLGDRAFRVTDLDANGMWLTLEEFVPQTTAAAEAEARDAYRADKRAPRAKAPLAFEKTLSAAQAMAKQRDGDLLIDFETTWCGPCKAMDRWVYNAKSIVDTAAAKKLTAVKVDGDEHRDLVKKYQVKAYPTIILLSADGVEKARVVGYQSVAKMLALISGKPTSKKP